MSTNMELWHKVCRTDPAAVKPITGKQYQGNSPKPYWLIEQATKTFGPVGIGWGCDVKSERFERLGEFDVLHVAVVAVWYVLDGKRSETFEQMGGTKAAYKASSGKLMVDEDAGKKSVTDGMVKCLSMIGFAGDIFSGRWDDSKYVAELKKEFAEESALERDLKASVEAARMSRSDYLDNVALDLIEFFRGGEEKAVCDLWFSDDTFKDADERAYTWGLLKTESTLRALLQANSPHRDHRTAPPSEQVSPGPGLKKIARPVQATQ